MASEDEGPEESLIDNHRTSLLDIIEDNNRAVNKKSLLHRMVIISKLRNPDVDRSLVGSQYEAMLKNLQNVYQSEVISGLMLIYMKHVVHVVESSIDMLLEIVKDLNQGEESDDSFISESKILVISHNIADRLFNQWSFRALEIQVHRLEAYEPSETVDKLIVDLSTQLVKLGAHIRKQPKMSVKKVLDSLHERVPDLLPNQAVVHYLLEEEDCQMILPSEYLDVYQTPFDVRSDTDLVWPLPTRLFPYN